MPGPDSYAELLSEGNILGRDFRISFGDSRIERCLLIAPHGGGIEPGSSEIMRAVADVGGWAWYEFAGFLRRGNRTALHMPSVRFDEPTLLNLLPRTGFVVAFHGANEIAEPRVYVGGLWTHGRHTVMESINANTKGHGIEAVDALEEEAAEFLRGLDAANLTNRGQRLEGVQLEFARGARNLLFPPDASREARGRRSAQLRPLAASINYAIQKLGEESATIPLGSS